MSQNIIHLPGIAPNISFIESHYTPALCDIILYGDLTYVPSPEGNVIFGLFFAIFLCVQLIFVCIYRIWNYSFAMSAGLVLEIVGYYGRIAMHYNVFKSNLFLINIICLTIAEFFYTAAIYLTLTRVIVHCGIHNSRFSPKAYSITLIASDLIAPILQSVGGSIADEAASTKAGRAEGVNIMIASLSFQVASLVLFIALAAKLSLKVKKGIINGLHELGSWIMFMRVSQGLHVISFACATILILIRSAYRVAELAHGFQSKLANDQITFIIFESAMMVLAINITTYFHPGCFTGREGWGYFGWGKNGKLPMSSQGNLAMGNDD